MTELAERLIGKSGKLLALIVKPVAHPDNRGSVRETYRESWFPDYVPPIKQLTQSNSKPMTLRGMHLHRAQWDAWRFVEGRALVRLMDHETGDQAFIDAGKEDVIAIPPGISHGFWTKGGCILVYALTNEWDGSDEFGWYPFDGLLTDTLYSPDDPQFEWPRRHWGLNMSERDLRATRLADFP